MIKGRRRRYRGPGAALRHTDDPMVQTDVQGSYTGIGEDGSKPVQDADDL